MRTNELLEFTERAADVFKNMPWENKEFYKEYLAQSYYYVFHSTRLLALAGSLTTMAQEDYYKRVIKHIAEERGHEKLAESDLKELGGKVFSYEELSTTKMLWEPQYYKTLIKSNSSFLGYVLALENIAAQSCPTIYKRLEKAYGKSASKFIHVHAEEDPGHVEKCVQQIEALKGVDRELAVQNLTQSCDAFAFFLNGVKLKSEQRFQDLYKLSRAA